MKLLALLALLLAGCAAAPLQLVTKVERVEVPIAVVEKCIDAADVPTVPKSRMPLAGNIEQLAAGASLDLRAFKQYATTADALLRNCTQSQ